MSLVFLIGLLLAAAYLIILYQIKVQKEPNSFVSWFLWLVLDIILFRSAYLVWIATQGKVPIPPILEIFTVGTAVIMLALISKDMFKIGLVEGLTIGLVIVCIGIHSQVGARTSLIVESIAVGVAGIPFLNMLRTKKSGKLTLAYSLLFLVASSLSDYLMMSGGEVTLEKGIYLFICTGYWLVAVVLVLFNQE